MFITEDLLILTRRVQRTHFSPCEKKIHVGEPWKPWSSLGLLFFWKPEITTGGTATEWGLQCSRDNRISGRGRDQEVALNHHRQLDVARVTDRRTKTLIRAVWITDFLHQLVDHGTSETKVDGQPTQVLLDLNKQKSSRFNDWDSTLRNQNRKLWTFSQFPDLSQRINTELFGWRGTWIPLKRPLLHHQKCIFLTFLPGLPQRNLWVFTRVTLNWGRGNNYAFQWWFEISSELTLLKTSSIAVVHQSRDRWSTVFWLRSIPAPALTMWSLHFLFWSAELPYTHWVTCRIPTWVMQPTEQGLLW